MLSGFILLDHIFKFYNITHIKSLNKILIKKYYIKILYKYLVIPKFIIGNIIYIFSKKDLHLTVTIKPY